MSHVIRLVILTSLASMLYCSAARAQESTATVSGRGVATIQRPASKMRMTIVLSARGKTLEEALAGLKDRRAAATLQLKTLKAEAASIQFTDTALSGAEGSDDVASMMRAQLGRGGGRVPKGLQLPVSVNVACTLTAEWPLKYATQDELLVAAKQLQDKVREADLAGLKEPKKLTPEEQELEEELANAERDYGSRGEAAPGEPAFVYVAAITEEERAAALADAFASAKADAARLAKAAGLELGGLIELSGQAGSAPDEDYNPYSAYAMRRYGASAAEQNPNEAIAHVPGPVTAQAMVEAKFRAK